jgi:hypothetical protein
MVGKSHQQNFDPKGGGDGGVIQLMSYIYSTFISHAMYGCEIMGIKKGNEVQS